MWQMRKLSQLSLLPQIPHIAIAVAVANIASFLVMKQSSSFGEDSKRKTIAVIASVANAIGRQGRQGRQMHKIIANIASIAYVASGALDNKVDTKNTTQPPSDIAIV